MNRRQFLTQGISLSMVGAAGCIEHFQPTVQLAGVRVVNYVNEDIKLDVVIQKNDSIVQTECVQLQAAEDGSALTSEGSPIECAWSGDDAEYVIEARLNDGDWMANEIAENLGTVPDEFQDVVAVSLEIYRDDEIVFNPRGCDLLTGGTMPPWTCPWVEC